MTSRWLISLGLALLVSGLSGCSETEWRTKDITGLMPELAFELTGASGKPLKAERFEGDLTLLFFGYTHCPDICPVTMGKLAAVLDTLPEEVAADTRVLFVSVDPDRDRPQRLADYTAGFGKRFVGATGNQDQLRSLTKRYRVTYSYGDAKGEDEEYLVSHSSAVFAFDRQGRARLMFRQDDGVDAIASDLVQLAR